MRQYICFLLAVVTLGIGVVHAEDNSLNGPWKMTVRQPADNWTQLDFSDAEWTEAMGGFGSPGTPAARISTQWRTKDIWLRRIVNVDAIPATPALYLHHDEDAEVYLNGKKIATFTGYTSDYFVHKLDDIAAEAIKKGDNLLAVHCKQTTGGQFIDVHLIDANQVPELPAPITPTDPFRSELITQWGAEVSADNAWQEYPRPQMVRSAWTNLNGNWNYAITKRNEPQPTSWSGKILVPFCIESKLSGVQRLLNANETLWYERSFEANSTDGRRTLLHFEAVDYECHIYVNGQEIGSHQGGNTPFTVDATKAVKLGSNQLVVKVHDTTAGSQLRGKQTLYPEGIWYTRVSGIWQTVWLEEVPSVYLTDVSITTDAAAGTISIKPKRNKDNVGGRFEVVAKDGGQVVAESDVAMSVAAADGLTVKVDSAKLWSPNSPHLYDLELSWTDDSGKLLDRVTSYAGIRSVGKVQDADGHWRFTLNGEILFHWGPLDQGWWPDGLLTPPSDEAMRFDVQYLQDAGFNMIRKHIKVEPRRYYYHCDKMGMLVWQDQVSGGRGPKWTRLDPNPSDAKWSDADHRQYLAEFDEMVDALENHPSIVVWVPFNEAWGQHRTVESGEWIAQRDPTRLVNIASGGNFWPVGDVVDEHRYPHPGFPFDPQRYADYIKVMGEFGGHGWAVKGHLWDANRDNWGYGGLPQSAEEYKQRYLESIRLLKELKGQGIAAGVYTQTTDVEGEINGLMTYDRKVLKLPAAELKQIHQGLVP